MNITLSVKDKIIIREKKIFISVGSHHPSKNAFYENENTQGNMFEIDYVMRSNFWKEDSSVLF